MSATGSSQRRSALGSREQAGEPGLPTLRALLWFPAATFVALLVLVGLGVSGSSTGALQEVFSAGSDPDLLLGEPRQVRSDEFLVQGSWTVSQVQQGFPATNRTFPGGMDATVFNDLPSQDWSSALRPHVWGPLVLPLDQGMAWKWWLPAWAVLSSCYAFVVSVLPRRQLAGALVAVATLFSPILQWWWLPTTTWPVVFAFATMTAVWWAMHGASARARWLWAALAAWAGVVMVMSIYVPFMVAVLTVVVPFTLGALVVSLRDEGASRTLRALAPLGACAAAGLVVIALWVYTRRDTVAAVLATVYPGTRFDQTGALDLEQMVAILAAPWGVALRENVLTGLGGNESEASTPFLFALFLAVPLGAIVYDRASRRVDWIAVGTLAVIPFVAAYWLVPGWDRLAHVLQVDRAPAARMRLTFLVLGVVAFALLGRALLRRPLGRRAWVGAGLAVALTLGVNYWVWLQLASVSSPVLGVSNWKPVVGLVVAGVALVALRQLTTGALAFAAASLVVAGAVNPLYRGVFDLRETNAGRQVMALDAERPGTWVGEGGWPAMAVLMQTGVSAYNGIQTYPPPGMWETIDPGRRDEEIWNRLAHVYWSFEPGEPRLTSPQRDVITATFDPCSDFAQRHITYLLARTPTASRCLTPVSQVADGQVDFSIHRISPPSDPSPRGPS